MRNDSSVGLINDRLWAAVTILVTGEGDVRHRVADACRTLEVIRPKELPENLKARLDEVLKCASKRGPMRSAEGTVIRDSFEHSISLRRNSTYRRYAEEIFAIWKELNGIV